MFEAMVLPGTCGEIGPILNSVKQWNLTLTKFLDAFLSKFGMPPIMKVVFLEISNNFCIG